MAFNTYKRDFWETNHGRTEDNYVTNLSLSNFCHLYGIPLFTNLHVLDIGVGDGQFCKECIYSGNMVTSIDICQAALDKVKDFANNTFFTTDIKKSLPADIAVAHLVFQHNPEDEIHRIIQDVNLKDSGIFYFQIATLDPNKPTLSPLILRDLNRGMLHFYSKEKMLEIVSKTNKEVIETLGPIGFADPYNFDWYLFKVKNATPTLKNEVNHGN